MKSAPFAALFLTTALSLGVAAQAAHAQTQMQGKTRAQVTDELKQAQHDGLVPAGKTQYPPTSDMIARNKELHELSMHKGEKSAQNDKHDDLARQ